MIVFKCVVAETKYIPVTATITVTQSFNSQEDLNYAKAGIEQSLEADNLLDSLNHQLFDYVVSTLPAQTIDVEYEFSPYMEDNVFKSKITLALKMQIPDMSKDTINLIMEDLAYDVLVYNILDYDRKVDIEL